MQNLPTKFQLIWPNGFREDFFLNWPIINKNCLWQSWQFCTGFSGEDQKEELLMVAMFVNGSG